MAKHNLIIYKTECDKIIKNDEFGHITIPCIYWSTCSEMHLWDFKYLVELNFYTCFSTLVVSNLTSKCPFPLSDSAELYSL
jgi:hypothetical protein